MASDLTNFLRAAAKRPFSWAADGADCLSWLGEWVAVRHGINPAEQFRGLYDTKISAYRVIAAYESRTALIQAAVAPLGIVRADPPEAGDIALVAAPEGELGAIVTGRFTACIGPEGLRFRQVPIIAAWRV